MFATLILGVAAGAGAPYAEPYLKNAIESMMLTDTPLTALELRSYALILGLLIAAILALIFGNGSGLVLMIGAALGALAPRLIEAVQARRAPDYDD